MNIKFAGMIDRTMWTMSADSMSEIVREFENPRTSLLNTTLLVTIDAESHIRLEMVWMIRNLRWFVSTQAISKLLLERPIQEAIGLDTKIILETPCYRYRLHVDADSLMEVGMDNEGSIARIRPSG